MSDPQPSTESSVATAAEPERIEYDVILTPDGLVVSIFVPYEQIGVVRVEDEEEPDDNGSSV